jgi:hypothetical protein
MAQNMDKPTPITITDEFVLASRKGLQKWGPEDSIRYVIDMRTTNPIPRAELLPENYKISDFMTLPQFVPGPKPVALIELKMQDEISKGFSQALTIQREERRVFRKFDLPELKENWDEAILTVLQEKMRTSDPSLTSYLRKESDALYEINEANDFYIEAKQDYLEEEAKYNTNVDKLELTEDNELAAAIKLQQLEEEEKKAFEALTSAQENEEIRKKQLSELKVKTGQLKQFIGKADKKLENIIKEELLMKYPTASTKQLYKFFTMQNKRPNGLQITGDEYVELLIENVITEEELNKLQTSSGNIKKTTVLWKLIEELRENQELYASDANIKEWINNKHNKETNLLDSILNEEESLPVFKKSKTQLQSFSDNPNLSPHKAKTKSKLAMKKLEEEKEMLENVIKKQLKNKTPIKVSTTKKMSKTSTQSKYRGKK